MTTNSTASNPTLLYLAMVQKQVVRSLAAVLVFGLFGNLSSCMVFCQKELRQNAVARLFTAASVFNILVLCYGIGYNLYTIDHVSTDTYSLVFCKLRLYIRHILLMIVRSYFILSCVACFALSSSRTFLRSLCRPKYVRAAIIAVPIVWPIIAIHMPFLKTIRKNQCIDVDSYVLPYAIYFFLIVGVMPVILMVFFTVLTVHNLQLLHNRVQASVATPMRVKARDRQFIRMLSALTTMYAATNVYYPVNVLYVAITYWQTKSAERLAIESLIFAITSNHILYINNVSPFFLFYSSSSAFRKIFWRVMHIYLRSLPVVRKFAQRHT